MPPEGKAGEKQEQDGDDVRGPEREAEILEDQERDHDREQAKEDEEEHAERRKTVLPVNAPWQCVRRQCFEMHTDALELRLAQNGKDFGRQIVLDKRPS